MRKPRETRGLADALKAATHEEISERLASRTEWRGDCLEWTGGPAGTYGRLTVGGVLMGAHRLAWELVNGPIPEGLWVLHSCDNPPCCNPAHLSLGDATENMRHRKERGHHPQLLKTHCPYGHPYSGTNLANRRDGYRKCKTCESATKRRTALRRRIEATHALGGHQLKTWPEPYRAAVKGEKRFEFRADDRGFAVGDRVLLREWDPAAEDYTGQSFPFTITYVVRGPDFGVPDGFAVLSIDRAVRRGRASSPGHVRQREAKRLRNLATRAEGER